MDLQEYKEKHPDKEKRLDRMEIQAKKAEILKDLQEHEGVKMLTEELIGRIDRINEQLLYAKLTEPEREVMMAERDCWEWFLQQFDIADQALERINKYLKKL